MLEGCTPKLKFPKLLKEGAGGSGGGGGPNLPLDGRGSGGEG